MRRSPDDEALGGIALWLRNADEGRASLGYRVAPRARGRRVAADAPVAVTEFAWTVPGLFRLEAFIEPDNPASLRAAERAGYLQLGGTRRNMAVCARIRGE